MKIIDVYGRKIIDVNESDLPENPEWYEVKYITLYQAYIDIWKICKSKSEVRRLVAQGALRINDVVVTDPERIIIISCEKKIDSPSECGIIET